MIKEFEIGKIYIHESGEEYLVIAHGKPTTRFDHAILVMVGPPHAHQIGNVFPYAYDKSYFNRWTEKE